MRVEGIMRGLGRRGMGKGREINIGVNGKGIGEE